MSGTNGFHVSVLDSVSSIINGLCDGDAPRKIKDFIENLINAREVKFLLEDKNIEKKNISKFVENYNTLKLLLQIAKENEPKIIVSIPVEEIFQSIRDLFDVAVDLPDGFPYNLFLDIIGLLTSFVLSSEDVSVVANIYQYNLYMVKVNHGEERGNNKRITRELVLRLQIISTMLECFLEKGDVDVLKKKLSEVDVDGSMLDSTLLSRLVTRNSSVVATQALLCIIPNYIKYSGNSEVLQSIWHDIAESVDLSRPYLIMCHLVNLFFAEKNLAINIFEDEKYWVLIQNGLTHNDPLIRKQALFLFKKSVKEMHRKDYKIACWKKEELNINDFDKKLNEGILKLKNGMKNFEVTNNKIFLIQSDSKNIMRWDPSAKEELFQTYLKIFGIIECLEETQAHIIKPIFEIIEEAMKENLNISWIVVVFQRILSHDNLSIVKWGVFKLLKIPFNEALGKLLVKSLTKTVLFASDGRTICEELKNYFKAGDKNFHKILIKEICSCTWSPEALYFVTSALATVKASVWEGNELLVITKFISTATVTYYTYIKSGIFCNLLKCIIHLTDITNIKLEIVANLLKNFDLRRGTKMWSEVVDWIQYCYSKRNAEEFILEFLPYEPNKILDEKCIAKTVVILYDAQLFGIMKCCGETPSYDVINALSTLFKDVDKRLYTDQKVIEYNLSVLHHILRENLNGKNAEKTRLVEMMLIFFPDVINFIRRQLKSHDGLSDFYSSQLHLNVFENILKAHRLYNIETDVGHFCTEIVNNLGAENSPVQKYVQIKLLKLIIHHVYSDKMIPNLKILQGHFKKNVNTPLTKSEKETKSTKDLQILWGKINSEYLEAKWWILNRLTNEVLFHLTKGSLNVGKFLAPPEIFGLCTEAFEVGGYSILIPVMSVLKDALPECQDSSQLGNVINAMWSLVLERRKSEEFSSLVEKFIDVIFQKELFDKDDAQEILLEYSKKIFEETTNSLPNALLRHMQKIGVKYNPNQVFAYILASALLFGSVQRKDELLIIQICSDIESLNISPLTNDWCNSGEIRARAVQIILTLDPESLDHQRFAVILVSQLQKLGEEFSKNKSRYFGDSFIHRVKHRLLQSLLLLEPYLPEGNVEDLSRWLFRSVISESHQPSVRYQQEWLLVRILSKYSRLQNSFWTFFDEALEKRPGSLCSLISVAFHLCKILPHEKISSWIDSAMQQFLPYCMAQHFSVRLYAQVTLQKLWESAKKLNIVEVVSKYEIISSCLIRSIESGNAVKNCNKLNEDFYFTVFHPLEHYSIQTIYSDLPRLAHIGSGEWISVELFKRLGVSDFSNKIPLKCKDESLENFKDSKWELRGTLENEELIDDGYSKGAGNNFQKKMIPVRSVDLDFEELFDLPEDIIRKKEKVRKDGLVVVASLIDRIPNLGGLARTCEVFGVSEYVLGSLKYAEDKQFQSLSVTAEKWISMKEVKPFYLTEYLIQMKRNGYTVLGAEQTAKSQSLATVKFPKKSLLLLGNEKEGIPPELLPILDVCIEIPQFGIVRSLNVHVAGALFIYEYAKQHLLENHLNGV